MQRGGSGQESGCYNQKFLFDLHEIAMLAALPRLFLAPMEGLADWLLRDLLTQAGGYDAAVCEFVRISGPKMPLRSFRLLIIELSRWR